ncbi:hypothetical protein [Micromonospora zamorensis]|uniref:hypothetical protein n=1 Tax=Micromonospora zamorensis TaxID=709883 RepID=UPI0033A4D10D
MRWVLKYAKLRRVEISPDVLRAVETDPASPAWKVIWEQSCHQGTCDAASAVLLPWLATTIAAFAEEQREMPLSLAGFIALDATDADRLTYGGEIEALRGLAVDRLPAASDDPAFVYLLQAILGFEGDEIWGKELDHLNDGEVDVHCPECGEEILVDLVTDSSEITPELPSELAERLHAEAMSAGRGEVAASLTRLFGRLVCADCDTSFELAENLAGVSYA